MANIANQPEIWLPVLGYEANYEVSNLGRVRSNDRVLELRSGVFMTMQGRVLKLATKGKGYLYASLTKDLKQKTLRVHRLVAAAFWGPSGLQIDHLNGVKSDNRLCNIEYVTAYENTIRRKLPGKTSSYLGVHWASLVGKWRASIKSGKKCICIGYFTNEEEAAEAYKKVASELYGLDKAG